MVNPVEPPSPFADGQMDFLYAFSVFTHLSLPLQRSWLADFAPILRPGGHALFSVHSERQAALLPPVSAEEYRRSGHVTLSAHAEGENICATYQVRGVTEGMIEAPLQLVGYYSSALESCGDQDLVLVRREARG